MSLTSRLVRTMAAKRKYFTEQERLEAARASRRIRQKRYRSSPEYKAKARAYEKTRRIRHPKTPAEQEAMKVYLKAYYRRTKEAFLAKCKARNEARVALLAGEARADRCEACGKLGEKVRGKEIVFDHCHKRGHFRGWLCQACNTILGLANDDPDRLRKLIAYLGRYRKHKPTQGSLAGV